VVVDLRILLIEENDHTVVEYKPEDDIEGVMKQQKKYSNLRQAIENDPELRDLLKSIRDKQQ
jgi:REP element-mobilizing transposase RayT